MSRAGLVSEQRLSDLNYSISITFEQSWARDNLLTLRQATKLRRTCNTASDLKYKNDDLSKSKWSLDKIYTRLFE